ncbi:hypothetical protein [Microbacterium lacticum]
MDAYYGGAVVRTSLMRPLMLADAVQANRVVLAFADVEADEYVDLVVVVDLCDHVAPVVR